MDKKAIVIGAGIVGLAAARALALKGYQVTVLERSGRASGASIRNFGMVWPVGQPEGTLLELALRSRAIWLEILQASGSWYEPTGSLHLAYREDEWAVLSEVAAQIAPERNCGLLSPAQTKAVSPAAVSEGLIGSFWSPTEVLVDPRIALHEIPIWLAEKYNVQFVWGTAVTAIAYPFVETPGKTYSADRVVICSGADFETLYPELFQQSPITRCKLQMLRMASQPDNWRMGPPLCGGLTLTHYRSFATAPSLATVKARMQAENPAWQQYGIHVMAAQNGQGEITIGDSHEYGLNPDPFDEQEINQLILDYLKGFARFPVEKLLHSWNGVYPKLTDGSDYLVLEPSPGVTVINGLGGAGMTLSFGLCEKYFCERLENAVL